MISKGMTVNGALQGNGIAKVEWTTEGEVVLDGTLTIAASGVVKGPVKAVHSQRGQMPELQFGQNYTVGTQEKTLEAAELEPETDDDLGNFAKN